MPLYEYGCEAGHRFEVKQKVSDPPLTTCQVCALPVSRLISAPAISFKGAGWYVTDYSNKMKPPAQEGKSESTASPSSSSPPETGSSRPQTTGSSGSCFSDASADLPLVHAPRRLAFALHFRLADRR